MIVKASWSWKDFDTRCWCKGTKKYIYSQDQYAEVDTDAWRQSRVGNNLKSFIAKKGFSEQKSCPTKQRKILGVCLKMSRSPVTSRSLSRGQAKAEVQKNMQGHTYTRRYTRNKNSEGCERLKGSTVSAGKNNYRGQWLHHHHLIMHKAFHNAVNRAVLLTDFALIKGISALVTAFFS